MVAVKMEKTKTYKGDPLSAISILDRKFLVAIALVASQTGRMESLSPPTVQVSYWMSCE